MKREMIKTTVVYLLLGIVGAVFLTGNVFAAEDEGQPIIVPTEPPIIPIIGAAFEEAFPKIPDPCEPLLSAEQPDPSREIIEQICKQPDLVPVPKSTGGASRFCVLDTIDKPETLVITVKNQGNADAGPSKTKVEFLVPTGLSPDLQTQTKDTFPIKIGESQNVRFKFPADCKGPGCFFKITVNSGVSPIPESIVGKTNNIEFSTCP